MQLAFYKAKGSLFNALIRLKTRSPYSHVEFVFDEVKNPGLYEILPRPAGDCSGVLSYSSANQDGGVRFTRLGLTEGKWDLVNLGRLSGERLLRTLCFCEERVGMKYDWLGILGFVFPFGEHQDNDRFCSEACTELLQTRSVLMGLRPEVVTKVLKAKPWMTSPGDLYNIVY